MRETEEFGIARTGVGRCENDSRFAIKAAWCKKLAFFSRSANMLQEVRPTFGVNSRVLRKRKRGIYFFRLDQFREIVRNCIFEAASSSRERTWRGNVPPATALQQSSVYGSPAIRDLLDDPGPERLADRIFELALRHHQIIVVFRLHRPVENHAQADRWPAPARSDSDGTSAKPRPGNSRLDDHGKLIEAGGRDRPYFISSRRSAFEPLRPHLGPGGEMQAAVLCSRSPRLLQGSGL